MKDKCNCVPAGLTLDQYVEQIFLRLPTSTLTHRETWALKLYIETLRDKLQEANSLVPQHKL